MLRAFSAAPALRRCSAAPLAAARRHFAAEAKSPRRNPFKKTILQRIREKPQNLFTMGLSFFMVIVSMHAYNSKVRLNNFELETASARIECQELKRKLDDEEWAREVMSELRPFASLSVEDAGRHLHSAIQRKIDENEALAAAAGPDGPIEEKAGMI